jgi:hypothetical protein
MRTAYLSLSDAQKTEERKKGRNDELKYSTGALVNHSKQMTKRNGNRICFLRYMTETKVRARRQMPSCHIRNTRKETLALVAEKPRKAGEQEQ